MNSNPFTEGHRYLVEYALAYVSRLYIFVVEEDKSFFSFKDRFEMVKRGVEDLENVFVIRSGNMIISANTFPVYFRKEAIKKYEERALANVDLRVFAQYIAPVVNIRYRFVGEEPFDLVTKEYNRKMKGIFQNLVSM